MDIPTRIKKLSPKRIAIWLVGIVATIGVLGFFVVPPTIKAIADKVVTYDFARLMQGARQVSCSGFGQAMIERM